MQTSTRRKIKWLLILIGVAIISIQFFPAAKDNVDSSISGEHISVVYRVPDSVLQVLETSCFDCHSNNTEYPLYYRIQPVGWWLRNHVNEGKEELNFSIFGTYSEKRKIKKLEEIEESVSDGWMPLGSYLWIHRYAKLTEDQKILIQNWTKTTLATMQ